VEHLVALPQYDILAYLIVGLAFIAACDLTCGTRIILRADWGVSQTIVLAIAAYIAGHVLAIISTSLLETVLPPPVQYLICKDCPRSKFFYTDRLETTTINKIREKSKENNGGKILNDTELFWDAYDTAKQDEHAFERIITFHQLFNFSRNGAFAFFIAGLVALVEGCRRRHGPRDETPAQSELAEGLPQWLNNSNAQAAIFFAVSALMFFRYLYFFRAHSIEVLTSFAFAH